MLFILYAFIFILAYFTPNDFVPVAFDSGGVTTGPITVPFIMALGLGVASVRGGKSAHDDSFGLVALCSVGPILAVLLLGLLYNSSGSYTDVVLTDVESLSEAINVILRILPEFFKEVALALSPIVVAFVIFQTIFLKLPKSQLIKMSVGVIYTYIGLVIFLTGVNVGFLPAGSYLGQSLGSLDNNWVLIPIGMVMGFFIVAAEPAVHVLNKQVEDVTGGAISKKAMLISLSLGVAVSIGIAMIRVLKGISIWYFIVPGYSIALILTFFVPPIFTGIAFDSGGVASGPMTATFMLPFAMGAAESAGGNILTDAFGLVAMVAMTPLITIQILGVVYNIKIKLNERVEEQIIEESGTDSEIIDFEGGAE
jgi:intracellular septation protein A